MKTSKTIDWFLSQERLDAKRLTAYLYFFHAWAYALLDDYEDKLEFKTTASSITEPYLKKTYGLSDITYPAETPSVKHEWLYQSILQTYGGKSTDELYQIILNDPPYQLAKKRKKFKTLILNNELQKHYRFLYQNSR